MKILKYIGIVLIFVVIAVSALLLYVSTSLPNVGEAPDLKIDYTPERIARGGTWRI